MIIPGERGTYPKARTPVVMPDGVPVPTAELIPVIATAPVQLAPYSIAPPKAYGYAPSTLANADGSKRHTFSSSMVSEWLECERKFAFQYIAGHKKPATKATTLGTQIHDVLEHYLKGHGWDFATYPEAAKLASHLAPLLPEPKTWGLIVEGEWRNESHPRHAWSGRIDWILYALSPKLRIKIGDHKSTSSIAKWAKSEDDLRENVQAILYAWHALATIEATLEAMVDEDVPTYAVLDLAQTVEEIDLQWTYVQTTGKPSPTPRTLTLSKKHILDRMSLIDDVAEGMSHALDTVTDPNELQPTTSACHKYGGCPFAPMCKMTTKQRISATMSQAAPGMSMIDQLKAKAAAARALTEGAASATAAQAPAATTAPSTPKPPTPPAATSTGAPAPSALERARAAAAAKAGTTTAPATTAAAKPPSTPKPPKPPTPPAPKHTGLSALVKRDALGKVTHSVAGAVLPPSIVSAQALHVDADVKPIDPLDESKAEWLEYWAGMFASNPGAPAFAEGALTVGDSTPSTDASAEEAAADWQPDAPQEGDAPTTSINPPESALVGTPAATASTGAAPTTPTSTDAAATSRKGKGGRPKGSTNKPKVEGPIVYVDCAPDSDEGTHLAGIFAEVHAELASGAEGAESILDYALVDYGKGQGMFALLAVEKVKKIPAGEELYVSTRMRETSLVLSQVLALAGRVVSPR